MTTQTLKQRVRDSITWASWKEWIVAPFAIQDAGIALLSRAFIVMLLAIDVLMMILHLLLWYTGLVNGEYFSLSRDRGYAEFFQYFKEIWLVLLFAWHALRTRTVNYLFWSGVFGYALIDDFFKIHERVGQSITLQFDFSALWGLRGADYGELLFYAVATAALLALLGAFYYFGSGAFRRDSIYLIGLLGLFAFFASGVDVVHMLIRETEFFRVFDVVEDGGEMVVMSIIVWFAFLLPVRSLLQRGEVYDGYRGRQARDVR